MNGSFEPTDGEVLFKLFLGTIALAVFVIVLVRLTWGIP